MTSLAAGIRPELVIALGQLRPLPDRTVMVGDRAHDVEGAAEHGIPTVVVGRGYGRHGLWATRRHRCGRRARGDRRRTAGGARCLTR